MDVLNVVSKGLHSLQTAVELLKPIATKLGGPSVAAIAELVASGVTIAENAVERIEDGRIVGDSRDTAVVNKMLAELQATNDELKDYIKNS